MADEVLHLSAGVRDMFFRAVEDIDDAVLTVFHEQQKKQMDDAKAEAEKASKRNRRRK